MNIETLPADYQTEIEKMLRLEGLSPETAAAICEPQILFLTDEYRNAPVRVMIVGQETRDAEKWLSEVVREGSDAMIAGQRKRFETNNFGIATAHDKNPFWRGCDDVCEVFDLTSRRSIAWTNISKVQLGESIGNSFSISKLSSAAQMEIVRWQRAMARAEIEYAKPDVIVFFTGGMRWMTRHLYQTDVSASVTDVCLERIEGTTKNTGYLSAPFMRNTISVFTNHPHAGRSSEAKSRTVNERMAALRWAVERHSSLNVS